MNYYNKILRALIIILIKESLLRPIIGHILVEQHVQNNKELNKVFLFTKKINYKNYKWENKNKLNRICFIVLYKYL